MRASVPTLALALILGLTGFSNLASAKEPLAPLAEPKLNDKAFHEAMLGYSLVALGGMYGTSVIIGAASDVSADKNLYIPIAGPFVDIAVRECGTAPNQPSCKHSFLNTAALTLDGLYQLIAAGVAVTSAVNLSTSSNPGVATAPKKSSSSFAVAPSSSPDGTGLGLSVSGAF